MSKPKIVITGMGWVTPLGQDLETVWNALLTGQSGVDRTSHFDASTFPTTFSAEVKDYDWTTYVKDPSLHEGIGLNTSFALGAAAQAWKQSGLAEYADLDPTRLGLYLGAGEGSLDFENYAASNLAGWDAEARAIDGKAWAQTATQIMDATREIEQEPNMPLAHLALEFNAQGPAYNCLTACAASTQAIGEAAHVLQRGDADVMLTGGCHTMIHPLGVTGFNRLTALSNRNDDPTTASRPFSVDRDGFVMGEGGGIIVLETEEHAKARGATILAEVAGYGSTADAYRITDIHPDGRGGAAAMQQALDNADVSIDQVDWIAAHGTSTKENDSIETRAIKAVFQQNDDPATVPPVSSIKSMMGHLIAAAGVVQAIAAVLAIRDGKLPPTAHLETPAPELDLDYIPKEARDLTGDGGVNVCLSNSFGFGGQNDTIVIRRA
ncbi:beta-ketoacyl-[acyl-carrier-protein] synthase family protein [Algisphaera agarilytica]|uniref:3-oxoacyl-[acyl-carrier-protein] synthase II n=1 Tax=Algisphaera agarilytica TaxID=1385975 RepID=A0A7X0H7J8_9BACT|nr:beta-ketoacyl-[acyl-carrier-protein] synthase family protein [Algisphaera agarilytica]MBB6429279.1 3-oxoacyl-[acyl-carrier-protein] synthase II [Algisphaera agarilytica]